MMTSSTQQSPTLTFSRSTMVTILLPVVFVLLTATNWSVEAKHHQHQQQQQRQQQKLLRGKHQQNNVVNKNGNDRTLQVIGSGVSNMNPVIIDPSDFQTLPPRDHIETLTGLSIQLTGLTDWRQVDKEKFEDFMEGFITSRINGLYDGKTLKDFATEITVTRIFQSGPFTVTVVYDQTLIWDDIAAEDRLAVHQSMNDPSATLLAVIPFARDTDKSAYIELLDVVTRDDGGLSEVTNVSNVALATESPTQTPTVSPTTQFPSDTPSTMPSTIPSASPTSPSASPTGGPSALPSDEPSAVPSRSPTGYPSVAPTIQSSAVPTTVPSDLPSLTPSIQPTSSPTIIDSDTPSFTPRTRPTTSPTSSPTVVISDEPSEVPSTSPTNLPTTSNPTIAPTETASQSPSSAPTIWRPQPTNEPITCSSENSITTQSSTGSDLTCHHGGWCSTDPDTGYAKCDCRPTLVFGRPNPSADNQYSRDITAYVGPTCEVPITRVCSLEDPSKPWYCANGGVCGFSSCICPPSFVGEYCEIQLSNVPTLAPVPSPPTTMSSDDGDDDSSSNTSKLVEETGIMCAADVQQCDDGSYVSRNPNMDCNFDPCPTSNVVVEDDINWEDFGAGDETNNGGDGAGGCPTDVQLCPDGTTYVSRNPVTCDFNACPETSESAATDVTDRETNNENESDDDTDDEDDPEVLLTCVICPLADHCVQEPDMIYPDVDNTAQVTCGEIESHTSMIPITTTGPTTPTQISQDDCTQLQQEVVMDGVCGGCGTVGCDGRRRQR